MDDEGPHTSLEGNPITPTSGLLSVEQSQSAKSVDGELLSAEPKTILLRDIFVECAQGDSTHRALDALSLSTLEFSKGEWDTKHIKRIGPTMWRHTNVNELLFIAQSETSGDIGCATLMKHDLVTFMAAENDVKLQLDFMMEEKEKHPLLWITFIISQTHNVGPLFKLSFNVPQKLAVENMLKFLQNPELFSAVFGHIQHLGDTGLMHRFGVMLYQQFQRTNNEGDINKAILGLGQAVQLTATDNTNYGTYISYAGLAFLRRFKVSRQLSDIDKAISMMEGAVACTSKDDVNLPALLNNLGNSFSMRFKCTGKLADIASAISTLQSAVQLTPERHKDKPSLLNDLGSSFLKQFEETGDLANIASAISTLQSAVQLTPAGHEDMHSRLNNLGNSFLRQFEQTGDLADIASAISTQQSAVQLTPEEHGDMPSLLRNLGSFFLKRFECTGDFADIVNSISTKQRAVQLTPEGHADMPALLNNLGNSFLTCFKQTGDFEDIESAISTQQKAVQLTPEGHTNMPSFLSNLGNSFLTQFDWTGDVADIASAISVQQKAVQLTPEGNTNMPSRLNNLGNSFLTQFEQTHDLSDIASVISTQQRAVQLTPKGHANMPTFLSNLGNSFATRFDWTGDLADITSAISIQQRAVQLTPEGHAYMSSRLNNLGLSFLMRFERTADLADIASAISTQQRAVQLTPEGHADMPSRLNNLGLSFRTQFEHTGDLADIASAISVQQRAVQLTPEGNANMPSRLNNLALSLYSRIQNTNNSDDIFQAISIFQSSAIQITGHPSYRFTAAQRWAQLSYIQDKSQSLPAFSVAIKLLPQIAGLEQTIHKRHSALINVYNITSSATAAAIGNSGLETALAWLEQGRCLIWTQINHLRMPADDLRAYNPSSADRFLKVANDLEVSGSCQEQRTTFSEGDITKMISLQEESHNHVHLAKEWNELLEEIRAIPQFQDFLQPPPVSKLLSHLPWDGPIVIFNIHKDRCDAIAIISHLDSPLHIPLETFSLQQAIQLRDDIHQYLTDHHVRQREADRATLRLRVGASDGAIMYKVLHELWQHVAKPILDALGYSLCQSNQPRIWWCPTGPLAFLPIHAAGIYSEERAPPGSCVSDYVVSSYTPSISVLLDKIKEAPTMDLEHANLLLISQPSTPGQTPIPGTEEETHAVRDMIKPPQKSLLLENASATRTRVKEEMKTHSWVHFACHAIQDTAEPLKSGVQLHDGRLELLEMMQKLPDTDFAFLSACQTSTGNEKLSDEVVHLAAGMLAAGYRSVVAMMWSIKDEYGPIVAKDFYGHILGANSNGQLDSANAAHALHYAIQQIRKELGDTEEALLTWVPYVHFGI